LLEHGRGELGHGELLVIHALGADDRSVGAEQEVDARVGHQVDLELVDVDVEGTVESERGGQRGDDLGDEPVEVLVGGALQTQLVAADVVDGLIVEHEGDIGVLEQGVGAEDGVVGLNDAGRDLGRGEHAEIELALLAVIDGKTLKKQRAEAGSGTTADRVEDQEALEALAIFGELADLVDDGLDVLLAGGVVTTSVVVGSIFLAAHEALGVEELSLGTLLDGIDHLNPM
jgi:hypothetical protein